MYINTHNKINILSATYNNKQSGNIITFLCFLEVLIKISGALYDGT